MKRIPIIFFLILSLLLTVVVVASVPGAGQHDFLRYWAATHLLVNGGNPYNGPELRALQKATQPGLMADEEEIVEAWNPPWLLLVLAPLGILPFNIAVPIWIFLNFAIITSVLMYSWYLAGGKNNPKLYLVVLGAGILFGSTIMLILLGQISTLILLALLLGVLFIQKERDWLAGAILLITTIKPHVVYLVLLLILIWSIIHRRWKIIAGMIVSAMISALIVWIFQPDWLNIYIKTILSLPYTELYTSTLGSLIASVFGINLFRYIGILLLPLAFPLAKQVDKIGWFTSLNLTLVISIPLSPYGFSFDQVVLLPAIVQMIAWIFKGELSLFLKWIIGIGLIAVYGVEFWLMYLGAVGYHWYALISLSIMVLYLLAWRYHRV